jgi:hypothetical protein
MEARGEVSEDAVRAYCSIYGIAVTDDEVSALRLRLDAILTDLQTLWRYDPSDWEMAIVFPTGRIPT